MIQVRLKYEVEAGPDLIPSRSGVQTLRSAGLYHYQHVEVDSSLFSPIRTGLVLHGEVE